MSLSIILLIFTVSVNDYRLGKLSAESVISDLKSSKTQESEALTYYPYGHKDRRLGVASELTRKVEDITQTCAVRVTTIPEMIAICDRFSESYTVLVISFYTKNEPAISRIVSPLSLHIPSEDFATKNDSEIDYVFKNIHRSEDMTKLLVTLWSACADKGASKCTDIAGKFVRLRTSWLTDIDK